MEEYTEKQQKLDELARKTLVMARNTLLVNLRFLDRALSMLEMHASEVTTAATDGEHLFYRAEHILQRYKEEREAIVHDYLHMVLHGIFRHMYVHTLVDQSCWNLACDIAVEYTIHGCVCVSSEEPLEPGEFYDVLVEESDLYDLFGTLRQPEER